MTDPTAKDTEAKVRLIATKRRTYALSLSVPGIPIEDYFAGAKLPKLLRSAKVYDTAGGPIIGIPFVDERRRPKRPRRPRAPKPKTKTGQSP
jgi:hypothetical protein